MNWPDIETNFGSMKQSKGNLYKSLLPLQVPMPRKDSWREGNVIEKGDGTCEVSFVAAKKKEGDEVKGKWQMMQVLILFNKIFTRKKISSLEENQKIPKLII